MTMTPERWAHIKQLLAEALERPPAQREEFIARAAGSDVALLAEVQSLLASHEQTGRFLDSIPEALCAEAFPAGDAARAGERLGAYRIVEMIGSGGMGDVFRAVRDDDQYRAEVAIKLMRADVRNPLAEQRFRTERQILATLEHRNIGRLLDGGTTPNGLPYVVMELIDGVPIDQYCDSAQLGVRERVQLFLQVCLAVSYAHQRLVIHRDLKPNNILVTPDGFVKLLDFGVAKLLDTPDAATVPANQTVTQMRALTLDYASPEQLSGGTVTTASDVYSLGVVLYWLLTGASPYGARVNDAQRIAEILSEATPARPSLATATRERAREIEGDLDNILLMALRKEPERRYSSVDQFAADLRNFLGGLPVMARRATFSYRSAKFVRRHKGQIAAALAVLIALVGGLWIAIREGREAERQRIVAQRHFDSVRKLANRLFDFHDEVARLPNSIAAREMLVETSLEYLDALNKEAGTDRVLQEELGIAYRRVGDIQGNPSEGNVGDSQAALASYAKSIALLESLYAAHPNDHRVGAVLARSYVQQVLMLFYTKGAEVAQSPMKKAMNLVEETQDGIASEFDRMQLLADMYWVQGIVVGTLGDTEAGLNGIDKMVAVTEAYAHGHPDDVRGSVALSHAYNNAGNVEDPRQSKEQINARNVAYLRKSVVIDEKLVSLHPAEDQYAWRLAEHRNELADELLKKGDFREAVEYFQLAAPVLAARAKDGKDAHAVFLSIKSESALAWARFQMGRAADPEKSLLRLESALADLVSRDRNLEAKSLLARTRIWLGTLYATRARRPHLTARQQLENWNRARRVLQRGIAGVQEAGATVAIEGSAKDLLDEAVATCAEAESAIARLSRAH
jgi:serine/threonine protein kinase